MKTNQISVIVKWTLPASLCKKWYKAWLILSSSLQPATDLDYIIIVIHTVRVLVTTNEINQKQSMYKQLASYTSNYIEPSLIYDQEFTIIELFNSPAVKITLASYTVYR